MPIREVSNRGGNTIGYFPSIKMKRKMAFESTIERDKMTLVDFDQDVQAFEEQPLAIPYQHNNKTVTYTPDILVQTLEKCTLVECKPATLVDTEDNLRKFREARKWCEQHHFEFEVVTDEQVRTGYRLSNVKRLTQYARHVIAPQVKSRIYNVLRTIGKPIPITTLGNEIVPDKPISVMSSILHLAYYHQVAIDLDKEKISDASLIWLPFQSKNMSNS